MLKVKTLKLSLRLSCRDHDDDDAEGPFDDDDDDNDLEDKEGYDDYDPDDNDDNENVVDQTLWSSFLFPPLICSISSSPLPLRKRNRTSFCSVEPQFIHRVSPVSLLL